MIEMLNCDCMEYMATLPDNAFELAIVDPPYGIGDTNQSGNTLHKKIKWNDAIPKQEYFEELERVSKNRIIWGANYYGGYIKDVGRIIHDKVCNTGRQLDELSDADIASHSFGVNIKMFRYGWRGNVQGNSINWKNTGEDARIHPTQKPVALYKWLLSRYAKPGDRILDTHGGSGSICIACHDLGFDLTWMELDADYYEAACKRYKMHAAQASLFDPAELTKETSAPELFEGWKK